MADDDSRAGARYAHPALLEWLDTCHGALAGSLAEAFAAPAREGMPRIMVSPAEGRLVGVLARLVGAQRALELGTLAGFSAIHLARGLAPGGRLWTVESEPRHAAVARANLAAAGVADRVTVVEGDALAVLDDLAAHGPFDLVFLDADKERYDRYGRWAAAHLRPGGLLLADNAYFFGKLLDPTHPGAAAVRRLHQEATLHFETACAPTPDGLLIGIKRG